jgi:hypothetical protein
LFGTAAYTALYDPSLLANDCNRNAPRHIVACHKGPLFGTHSFALAHITALSQTCLASARVRRQQPAMGHHPCLTACLLTAWPIIRHSPQSNLPRLFLPFDHHLRKIAEAPISACAPADGTRRKCWCLPLGFTGRCDLGYAASDHDPAMRLTCDGHLVRCVSTLPLLSVRRRR